MSDLQIINQASEQAFTRSGAPFDPSLLVWSIKEERGSHRIDFQPLASLFSVSLFQGVRLTALEMLKTHSSDTVHNSIQRILHLARSIGPKEKIDAHDLLNYTSSLKREHLCYLGHIAAFMKRWVELGYPGLDPDVLGFFKAVRIPGNMKGAAVRQSCPYKGPFTEIELQAIAENAREAFRLGKVSRADYAIFLLLMTTGTRPGQVSMLVCGDLEAPKIDHTAWKLHLPSLKKRTPKRLTRERPIPAELARLLVDQAQEVATDKRLDGVIVAMRPLFMSEDVSDFADIRLAHIGRSGVDDALKRVAKAITVRSERTGQPIAITATRFRRTLGTRAIEEGYAPKIVADMLDHADLQNVSVYVENRSSIVDRIDAVLAAKLGPIAQLFLGKVIEREQDAKVDDPVARRVGSGHDRPVGTCGGPSACAKHAPIACYTCASFMPWRDAPHERLLQTLIDERDRLLVSGIDPRIAAVNDASILAIADVIGRCNPHAETNADG